jgi:hypothetical protein
MEMNWLLATGSRVYAGGVMRCGFTLRSVLETEKQGQA